jgi:hypothetical protein
MWTVHGYTIDGGGRRRGSRLQRLKLALSGDETLQAAGLDSLMLLVGELGQTICGSAQILTQQRAACHDLMLDRLLDQRVLTDAQSGGNLSS